MQINFSELMAIKVRLLELIITNEELLRILKNQSLKSLTFFLIIIRIIRLLQYLKCKKNWPALAGCLTVFLFYVKIHLEPLADFLSKLAHNFQKEFFRKFIPQNITLAKISFLGLFCGVMDSSNPVSEQRTQFKHFESNSLRE